MSRHDTTRQGMIRQDMTLHDQARCRLTQNQTRLRDAMQYEELIRLAETRLAQNTLKKVMQGNSSDRFNVVSDIVQGKLS